MDDKYRKLAEKLRFSSSLKRDAKLLADFARQERLEEHHTHCPFKRLGTEYGCIRCIELGDEIAIKGANAALQSAKAEEGKNAK